MTDEEIIKGYIKCQPRLALAHVRAIQNTAVREAILKNWALWRRKGQELALEDIEPQYDQVLLLCGRAWGKTRWVAEFIREYCQDPDHRGHRVAVIGKNREDVQKVIYEGESGLFNCMTETEKKSLHYDKAKLDITFKINNVQLFGIPADRPEKMRGPQYHLIVSDEICKYQYPQEVLDQMDMCLRLGERPLAIFATTPKPTKTIRNLHDDPRTLVIRGPSYDNHFLSSRYFEKLKRKLTLRMYQQEILARILDDNQHALFKPSDIEQQRLHSRASLPELRRIVVAIDPATTSNEESDATGIVVVGVDMNGHLYILEDCTMEAATPREWAQKAVDAYDYWNANFIVAEGNQGGEMVNYTIHTIRNSIKIERVHAKVGKAARAEPVSALYEQKLVHHLGVMAELENEMTEWDPGTTSISPNRLDALVWGCTMLMPRREESDIQIAFG